MEVDRILYIFGSFTRKKDKRKSLDQSSLSAGNSPLHKTQYRPASQNLNCQNLPVPPRTSAYKVVKKNEELKEWECGLCRKTLVEPRLLACLHNFCTRCLQNLHQEGEVEAWSEDAGSIQLEAEGSGSGSAGSGYESDPRRSGSERSWEKPHKYGILTRKISGKSVQVLVCPRCQQENPLPLGGVAALPLNAVLLRRIAAAEQPTDGVLCDLCDCDNKAESRCGDCLISVCTGCSAAHARTAATASHALRPLRMRPARCGLHPGGELSVYCATCQQVVCRDCCVIAHAGHALASAARAAAERARLLRDACARAKHVPENVERATRNLNLHAMEADTAASLVESELTTWATNYRRAVDSHCRSLCAAAARARARRRLRAEEQTRALSERAIHTVEAVGFAEELLTEAREDELLSLSGAVVRRLERLSDLQQLSEPPKCELRFATNAPVGDSLVGRLLTQAPDPEKCVLHVEGLQDLRVDCEHEAIFELRDSSGERIWCGGEQVLGYFRRSDSSARPLSARVTDRADGSYALAVAAPSPGAYLLAVTVNNKPVKGSPFPCAARASLAHSGQFHCCAFCSSGGLRAAKCGCGGQMGHGYKGCGHGHAGWPGGRHWSCCGSTRRRGPCERLPPRPTSVTYQVSL